MMQVKNKLTCITNVSSGKVLTVSPDGKVVEEVFVQGKSEQLWRKGEQNDEGYFTLKKFESNQVLTAVSGNSLEIKGDHF